MGDRQLIIEWINLLFQFAPLIRREQKKNKEIFTTNGSCLIFCYVGVRKIHLG